MKTSKLLPLSAALGLAIGALTPAAPVLADDIWDMMNPAWWLGLDDDDDDDWRYWAYGPGRYRHGPYGWGGPYGWNGPYGWGGPFAWGGGYPGYWGHGGQSMAQNDSAEPPPPQIPE